MANADVKVSYNPTSNMYLGSGTAPVPEMMKAGITIGLATDGPASNNNHSMVEVLKFAALLQKVHAEDPRVLTAERVVEMATVDGARALGLNQVGSLELGKRADFFIADFDSVNAAPVHNPASTLVYSAIGAEVRTVAIEGRLVLRDGAFASIDEQDVVRRAQQAASELVKRAGIDHLRNRPWRSVAIDGPPAAEPH
jgi:5-methylthioadenosine/S-adenosylhomocysteine deaminase